MSSRVLKKLHCEKDLAATLGIDGMSESDDGGSSQATGAIRKQLANNRFELLNSVDHSLSDTEAKEDDDRENEPPQEEHERNKLEKQDSTHSTDSLKRKKKKKKKKLKSQKSTEENLDDAEDEVEASIREVNKILGEPEIPSETTHHASSSSSSKPPHEKSLLSIDLRNFNPDNEMRKIFGSKVIQNEQMKRKSRVRGHGRSTVLVSPKNWPHVGKPGLSMSLLENKDGIYYFTFEHSKQYQQTQVQFLEAVESYNPDNIVVLLNSHPYHIDALIQFSDICRMGEDAQMAAELIERALYCMECCMHSLFNFAQGNCRLDYRRAENRSFYIAIFKHLTYVGQRGCSRTALEFCKFLLSLDPDTDPLCVMLMIDYYALRSAQYEFLIKLYNEWNAARNLSQLPNFAFSVPLAMYLQAVEENKSTVQADTVLQDALLMFPGVLMPLLDKCSVHPDSQVANHAFFIKANDPPALSQLQALYIGRTHMLWKQPDTIFWLERNVQQVLQRVQDNDPYVEECQEKRQIRYKGMPQLILRHIILSNIKEATVTLPQDLTQNPIFSFDPLPPSDAIISYSRPPRTATADDRGMISMFLRSILPNFNMPRDAAGAVGVNREAANVAERADTNDLRRSVTSLLDAMRDLLSNIHLADVPNEGDVDSDEDREE